MSDESILNDFTEGFAKMAESYGVKGDQIKDLLGLAVDLARREMNPDAFDAGFQSVIGG